jgi:serine/threonine-protein kinase RsbW
MNVRTSTRLRRERAAVPTARAFVRQALRAFQVPSETLDRLVLAVAEACNNAILHATGEGFGITLVVEGSRCTITVSDTGAGFVPPRRPRMPGPEATGNRGLALMQALVDRVEVSSNAAGTTVVLQQALATGQSGAGALAAGSQPGRAAS